MRVALVLGSGGARGYAHLGVLNELRARGHDVVAIAGTSMGALVGGLAAAGRDEEFAAWAVSLSQRKVWQLLDPTLAAPGAIRGTKVLSTIGGMLGDTLIEDLPIPFTAIASDLTTQREVWFQRGPVTAAIRASIAIPGALTPVVMGGRVLVDGGLLNPVPVEPILAVDSDFTLAVNLTGPDAPVSAVHEEAELPEGQDAATWLTRVGVDVDRWKLSLRHSRADRGRPEPDLDSDSEHAVQRAKASSPASNTAMQLSTMDVMLGSWETVQAAIARYRMATNPPDVVVTVPLRACRALDFHRAEEMMALGQRLTAKALDEAGR